MKRCVRCRKEMDDDALYCPRCGASQPGRTADQILGTVVAGRYLVQKVLGKGGTGTVYRTRHVGLGTHVALKLLHYELSRDESAIERFRKEAVTIASIDNDHILRVFDFGRAEDGRFFVAMELLAGQTLEEALRQGPFELGRALDIALQVADVLEEVHSRGFVHRALRAKNVFLAERKGRRDFVKLLDFGMAKLVRGMDAGHTASALRFVDPVYLSPEQAQGLPVDQRTDVYSLGVILYQMLTGRPPFTGTDALEVLARQTETLPERPSSLRADLSGRLDAAILRALAKRPESRYESMAAFAEALRNAVQTPQTTGAARPSEAAESPAERARRPAETWDRGLAPPTPSEPKADVPEDLPPDRTILGVGGLPLTPAAAPAPESRLPGNEEIGPAASGSAQQDGAGAGTSETTELQSVAGGPQAGPGPRGVVPVGMQPESAPLPASGASPPGGQTTESADGEATRGEASARPSEEAPKVPVAQVPPSTEGSPGRKPAVASFGAEGIQEPTGDGADASSEPATSESGPGETPDPTMSQLWYAEGEEAQRKLAEMMAGTDGASETEHVLPAVYEHLDEGRRRAAGRLVALAGLATLFLVAGLLGLLFFFHGTHRSSQPASASRVAAAEGADAGQHPVGTDGGPGVDAVGRVDAGPAAGGDAEIRPSRDAGLLLLPADEVLVPASRQVHRGRAHRGRRRPSRPDRARPGPESLPEPPAPRPGPSTQSSVAAELRAGRVALRSGDLAAAERHFRAALAAGAKARALAGLGEVAFERGRNGEAIRLLKRALRAGAGLRTLVLLGNAYFKAGRLQQAKAVYEKVLRRRPGHPEAKRNLGIVLKRLGESPGK